MRYLLLFGLLLVPAPASAQWMTLDFQDPLPFTMQTPNGPRDMAVGGLLGTCATGVLWNFTRVAPGAGNGGFRDRGYARYRYCNYLLSRISQGQSGWTEAGSLFRPSGGWPQDTFYGRVRMYVEQPITVASGGDDSRQMKFFIWHQDVYDGDQRVIAFLENGQNCGRPDNTHSCFTLQRNINHYTDTATVPLPVGQWSHLQWSWRHGPQGTSFVKIWLNNDSQNSPTAQDLQLTGVPGLPGGTSSWVKDNRGYDAQFWLGNSANTGTRFGQDLVLRLMDFELDGVFDSSWSAGGGPSGPSAPQNLRIMP